MSLLRARVRYKLMRLSAFFLGLEHGMLMQTWFTAGLIGVSLLVNYLLTR